MQPIKKGDDELVEMLKWVVPIVVYMVLVRIFVGDSAHSRTLDIVLGLPLLVGCVWLLVLMPPFVLYRWLKEAPLMMVHPWSRALLLLCSCLVPLTAVFVAVLPMTAHGIRVSRPLFSDFWLLATFSGAAFLSFLAVSKVTRSRGAMVVPELEDHIFESSRTEPKGDGAEQPRGQMKFAEIVALLAGISTIVGVIYMIARDIVTH